jgi:iron complex transport system ATP-binding protein
VTLAVEAATVRAGSRIIVDRVSLTALRGRVTGLIGPNGAGKSTLMRAMLGLQPMDAGEVRFDGVDFLALPRRSRAQLAAFVDQASATEARLTALDVVMLGRIPFQSTWQTAPTAEDAQIVDAALASVGMSGFEQRLFHTLSGGEQQRLQVARALAQQPRLLVLDEPTNHLDVSAQLAVLELLRARATSGATVLLALHDLNLAAAYCDDLVALHAGRVVAQGTPEAVLTPALLGEVYQVTATLLRHPNSGRPIIAYGR